MVEAAEARVEIAWAVPVAPAVLVMAPVEIVEAVGCQWIWVEAAWEVEWEEEWVVVWAAVWVEEWAEEGGDEMPRSTSYSRSGF